MVRGTKPWAWALLALTPVMWWLTGQLLYWPDGGDRTSYVMRDIRFATGHEARRAYPAIGMWWMYFTVNRSRWT